jgi:hypothetical protein
MLAYFFRKVTGDHWTEIPVEVEVEGLYYFVLIFIIIQNFVMLKYVFFYPS